MASERSLRTGPIVFHSACSRLHLGLRLVPLRGAGERLRLRHAALPSSPGCPCARWRGGTRSTFRRSKKLAAGGAEAVPQRARLLARHRARRPATPSAGPAGARRSSPSPWTRPATRPPRAGPPSSSGSRRAPRPRAAKCALQRARTTARAALKRFHIASACSRGAWLACFQRSSSSRSSRAAARQVLDRAQLLHALAQLFLDGQVGPALPFVGLLELLDARVERGARGLEAREQGVALLARWAGAAARAARRATRAARAARRPGAAAARAASASTRAQSACRRARLWAASFSRTAARFRLPRLQPGHRARVARLRVLVHLVHGLQAGPVLAQDGPALAGHPQVGVFGQLLQLGAQRVHAGAAVARGEPGVVRLRAPLDAPPRSGAASASASGPSSAGSRAQASSASLSAAGASSPSSASTVWRNATRAATSSLGVRRRARRLARLRRVVRREGGSARRPRPRPPARLRGGGLRGTAPGARPQAGRPAVGIASSAPARAAPRPGCARGRPPLPARRGRSSFSTAASAVSLYSHFSASSASSAASCSRSTASRRASAWVAVRATAASARGLSSRPTASARTSGATATRAPLPPGAAAG